MSTRFIKKTMKKTCLCKIAKNSICYLSDFYIDIYILNEYIISIYTHVCVCFGYLLSNFKKGSGYKFLYQKSIKILFFML